MIELVWILKPEPTAVRTGHRHFFNFFFILEYQRLLLSRDMDGFRRQSCQYLAKKYLEIDMKSRTLLSVENIGENYFSLDSLVIRL